MNAPRIRVDFNNRVRGGLVRSSARRADRPVHEGDSVIAFQPGEDMEHFGRVVELDPQTGRLAIEIDWTSHAKLATVKSSDNHDIQFLVWQKLPYLIHGSKPAKVAGSSSPQTVSQLARPVAPFADVQ